jgi:hypothetical protein
VPNVVLQRQTGAVHRGVELLHKSADFETILIDIGILRYWGMTTTVLKYC